MEFDAPRHDYNRRRESYVTIMRRRAIVGLPTTETQMRTADTPIDKVAIQIFRAENPRSRAADWITYYGSGSGRRTYTCVACRRLVDTDSAKYPQTKHAIRSCADHVDACGEIARCRRAAKRVRKSVVNFVANVTGVEAGMKRDLTVGEFAMALRRPGVPLRDRFRTYPGGKVTLVDGTECGADEACGECQRKWAQCTCEQEAA